MSTVSNQMVVSLNEKSKSGHSSIGKTKGLISLAIAMFGLLVTVTGLGLFVAPHGPGAAQGWTFLGMSGKLLKDLHIWIGFAMVLPIMIHFTLNFKMFLGELKQLFR